MAAGGADVAILDKYRAPRSLFVGDEGWRGLDGEVEEIKGIGREALALTADVSNSQEANEFVCKANRVLGKEISLKSGLAKGIEGWIVRREKKQ